MGIKLSPEFKKIVDAASLRVDLRERIAGLTMEEAKEALKFIDELRAKRN